MSSETENVTYPTIQSTLKLVMETGRYPQWSLWTWRKILLSMDFRLQKKSDVANAFMIESKHIIDWREVYLRCMEQNRLLGRPIYCKSGIYLCKLESVSL